MKSLLKTTEQCIVAFEAWTVMWIFLLSNQIFDRHSVNSTIKCIILYSCPWKGDFWVSIPSSLPRLYLV